MANGGTDLYNFIVKDLFLFFYCHTNNTLEIEFDAKFRPHDFHSFTGGGWLLPFARLVTLSLAFVFISNIWLATRGHTPHQEKPITDLVSKLCFVTKTKWRGEW